MYLNNLFKKFLAFFLVFSLSAPAVEAGSRAKKVHTSRIKKPRTPRVRKIRAPRVRKVRTPRVRKVRTPRVRTPRVPRLTARQQAAARIAAQAEAARVAAIRQRQADPARIAVVGQQMNALLVQPLGLLVQNVCQRFVPGNPNPVNFPTCDIGYGAMEKARSDIYKSDIYNFNAPTAPIFHPYHPTDGLLGPGQFSHSAVTLNVKLPGYNPHRIPAVIRALVGTIEPADIQMGLNAQHVGCWGAPAPVPLQFKPQYGIEPNAPAASALRYEHLYTVRTGLFPRHNSQARIQNQPPNGLIEEPRISIHNSGPNTSNVLSSSVLNIQNLDCTMSHIVDSYTEYRDLQTGRTKAFICRHLLLNDGDQQLFEGILNASQDLQDMNQRIRNAKTAGTGFANIDPDDLF